MYELSSVYPLGYDIRTKEQIYALAPSDVIETGPSTSFYITGFTKAQIASYDKASDVTLSAELGLGASVSIDLKRKLSEKLKHSTSKTGLVLLVLRQSQFSIQSNVKGKEMPGAGGESGAGHYISAYTGYRGFMIIFTGQTEKQEAQHSDSFEAAVGAFYQGVGLKAGGGKSTEKTQSSQFEARQFSAMAFGCYLPPTAASIGADGVATAETIKQVYEEFLKGTSDHAPQPIIDDDESKTQPYDLKDTPYRELRSLLSQLSETYKEAIVAWPAHKTLKKSEINNLDRRLSSRVGFNFSEIEFQSDCLEVVQLAEKLLQQGIVFDGASVSLITSYNEDQKYYLGTNSGSDAHPIFSNVDEQFIIEQAGNNHFYLKTSKNGYLAYDKKNMQFISSTNRHEEVSVEKCWQLEVMREFPVLVCGDWSISMPKKPDVLAPTQKSNVSEIANFRIINHMIAWTDLFEDRKRYIAEQSLVKQSPKSGQYDTKLSHLFSVVLPKLQSGSDKKPWLFTLGVTGAGKSALTNVLMGNRLQSIGPDSVKVIDKVGQIAEIGSSDADSKTLFPEAFQFASAKFILCDFPGFFDTNKNNRDIQSFSMQLLNALAQDIRGIIIVIDISSLSNGERMKPFKKLSKLIAKILDLQSMKERVTFVINLKGDVRFKLKDLVDRNNPNSKICSVEKFFSRQIEEKKLSQKLSLRALSNLKNDHEQFKENMPPSFTNSPDCNKFIENQAKKIQETEEEIGRSEEELADLIQTQDFLKQMTIDNTVLWGDSERVEIRTVLDERFSNLEPSNGQKMLKFDQIEQEDPEFYKEVASWVNNTWHQPLQSKRSLIETLEREWLRIHLVANDQIVDLKNRLAQIKDRADLYVKEIDAWLTEQAFQPVFFAGSRKGWSLPFCPAQLKALTAEYHSSPFTKVTHTEQSVIKEGLKPKVTYQGITLEKEQGSSCDDYDSEAQVYRRLKSVKYSSTNKLRHFDELPMDGRLILGEIRGHRVDNVSLSTKFKEFEGEIKQFLSKFREVIEAYRWVNVIDNEDWKYLGKLTNDLLQITRLTGSTDYRSRRSFLKKAEELLVSLSKTTGQFIHSVEGIEKDTGRMKQLSYSYADTYRGSKKETKRAKDKTRCLEELDQCLIEYRKELSTKEWEGAFQGIRILNHLDVFNISDEESTTFSDLLDLYDNFFDRVIKDPELRRELTFYSDVSDNQASSPSGSKKSQSPWGAGLTLYGRKTGKINAKEPDPEEESASAASVDPEQLQNPPPRANTK